MQKFGLRVFGQQAQHTGQLLPQASEQLQCGCIAQRQHNAPCAGAFFAVLDGLAAFTHTVAVFADTGVVVDTRDVFADFTAAHHRDAQILLGHLVRRPTQHRAPASQHRHVVGDGQGIAQLVGDEHNRVTVIRKDANPPQQLGGLLRGEHCGGFIENQQLDVARQSLHDFASLLRAHGQTVDTRLRIDGQAGA